MPLVRYEVRCEHSLANPELYRTAGQDDSEGLLEGVAMAGLVGIVRQLGDLAEFAAEIFHDLHDDIMAVVSRGRDLKSRVARLEVDLPAVEKALLAESSQFKFAYGTRSTWRAPLPMDQNLCVQGELPRFVRNFYDDCRGPPRLFLLDKFDEAGRGACVKRYTDPTFFRLSWAASLVAKAEQQRREREAELLEKNIAAAENAGRKIYARERLSSALFENLEGFTGDFTPELRSRRLDHVFELPTEGVLTPDGPLSPEGLRSPERRRHHPVPQVADGPVLAPLKISAKDIANAQRGRRAFQEDGALSDEDESSDAEFYVDALTTMGSDPDSEPGSRTRWEVDSLQSRFGLEFDQPESLNHSVLKAHVEAHRHTPLRQSDEMEDDEDFARRLGLERPVAGFDTVREWEDDGGQSDDLSGSVEIIETASVSSVDEDLHNSLAIVVHNALQEASPPSNLSDKPPDTLSDTLPYTLSDKPPDTFSDKRPYSLFDNPPDELPYTLSDEPPDILSDMPPDTLSDKPPDTFSDKPPDTFSDKPSDILSEKPTDILSEKPTDILSEKSTDILSEKPTDILSEKPTDILSGKPTDEKPNDILPEKPPDTFSDKLPYQRPHGSVPPSTRLSGKGSDKTPKKPSPSKLPSDKLSDKTPKKPSPSKLPSDKLSDKTPNKSPEKPTYQSHESVSLLDSFRPSVRVKPIVASIEARAKTNNTKPSPQLEGNDDSVLEPLKKTSSPVTTPRSRRLWAKDNVAVRILQSAELDQREGTNGDLEPCNILRSRMLESEGNSTTTNEEERVSGCKLKLFSSISSPYANVSVSSVVEEEEGYSSSASSSPKGLPNFCALLSPSESPPRVAEGLMGPPSLFLTNSHFDRKIPRVPPVTPFLSDSPSVSRSPSLNTKPSATPGNVLLRSSLPPQMIERLVASDSDKLKNAPASSPRRAGENGVLQSEPSRNQSSTLPNPVPRPRTWVDRSESNVAATLRAIRQAAVIASDDDTGSECRSDC